MFDALAEPNRRRLMALLLKGERPAGDLVWALRLSQPAVSKHLKVLREAGLVEARVDGQRRMYRLRPEPLAELERWLDPYRRFWGGKLDALEHHLDKGS
ncbi:MAG TPA: metalloregulator ArsR/SmtB family transcription factor [Caulobacteraceae bacterium]|nr:metalloregulator ArsR/SmtB family transcription factor [Caulobacteraceae bacterium]